MGEFFTVPFGPTEPDRNYQVEDENFLADWWKEWGSDDLYKIYRKFGINTFRRSTALLGLDRFIRESGFTGKRCIEIGTCKGLTAIILARHFEEVCTFDIYPDDDKRMLAEFCGIKNIRFFDVADNAERESIVNGLEFDAAYSDGNHKDDAEVDFKLVRKCGRVMFHEYWPLQPPVWGLVNNLRRSGTVKLHSDCFVLWTANGPAA